MFAVIAAFALATATLVVPLAHQAYAKARQAGCASGQFKPQGPPPSGQEIAACARPASP
jgi:hypothetical protein